MPTLVQSSIKRHEINVTLGCLLRFLGIEFIAQPAPRL
jgi:hypothetical protein